ncbi:MULTISPECIES: Sec-independent protein translocase subunit TatA [unclassified Streptomyces]|uniref:Sec-independent protein translocase subunit TatA n=1 Tax=unclassified Streptomyces TaxID=2593676 RepID=UPI00202E163B|nr:MULTISPECIES: Sec-independent protein translocase subunit TatA [unclassified Streptomyces]MCM1970572.1 Sec-independent protein translocase subunit TatA [Streptomyces sp. G1]MCX5130381.1 Sec-independent protein translocase subunit TatA [Streptomyces sp. NBC_00347]
MFGKIGAPEILLLLVAVVLLFGAKKLPDLARSVGKSARILKSEAKAMKTDTARPQAPADPPGDPAHQAPLGLEAAPAHAAGPREPAGVTTQR